MPHTALYRAKRPQAFRDLIGQPPIVRTLKNQLTAGSMSHAYVFCGTRGTGKTSAAKIFARAVNCETPRDGEPCNDCETCRDILAERNFNVMEIDAASNNGVDNMRDLCDEAKYPPSSGRYKVYIIDEAHMLSASAFNALLKTLEEPPAHVIFILATTDPQKIPATILSRCQRYDFKRIAMADMVTAMRGYVAGAAEDDALHYIASLADGAMRDALSILDQCLSFYSGETITLAGARELLGAVDTRVLFELTDAMADADLPRILTRIDGMVKDGRDVGQFISDWIRHCRDVLVAAQPGGAELLEQPDDIRRALQAQSARFAPDTLIGYLYALSELQRDIRFAPHARTALEVCVIKLCKPQGVQAVQTAPAAAPPEVKPPVKEAPIAKEAPPEVKPPPAAARKTSLAAVEKGWAAFHKACPMPLRSWLSGKGVKADGGTLHIFCNDEAHIKHLYDRKKELGERLAAAFDLPDAPNLAFSVRDGHNKSVPLEEIKEPSIADDAWAGMGEQVEIEPEW